MKSPLTPVSWIFAGIAVLGLVFQRPEAIVLGIGGFIVMVIAKGFRLSANVRNESPLDSVSNENRSRLIPLLKASKDIQEISETNQNSAVVKVLGAEAEKECNSLISQAVRLLNSREALQAAVNSSAGVSRTIATMQSNLEAAKSESERDMLKSAITAHQMQLAQVESAAATIASIDTNLSQATALLSELRTRLAMAAAGQSEIEQDNMRETLSQLHALNSSIEESSELVGGTN